jgi:RNA polymerase sigma-70 factor (ECF subfamily)
MQDIDTGAELYRRFLAGDNEAFAELVMLYKGALTGYIVGIIGKGQDAEDVAIDTFATLLSLKKAFREDCTFKTFLFSIGKNLAFKYLRKHKEQTYLSLADFEGEIGSVSLEDGVFREQDKARLRVCMGRLAPDHRSVLHLLFFEDMSYAEAGQVMQKSEGQIRGLVFRAKGNLKRLLEMEGFVYAER